MTNRNNGVQALKVGALFLELALVSGLVFALILGLCSSGAIYTPQSAVPAKEDMSVPCLRCSQRVPTDSCLPSLCVERERGLFCCSDRRYSR